MINNEFALEFRDVDVETYFNQKYDRIDLIEIESDMAVLQSLLNRIDENFFEFILHSGDTLVDLLEVYQRCLNVLKNFKTDTKKEYNDEESRLYNEKLASKLAFFEDDLSLFLTEDRYLLASGTFNNGAVLLVLSNDLLFIGERVKLKYKLKRALLSSFYRISGSGNNMNLHVEDLDMSLSGDAKLIEDFIDFTTKPRIDSGDVSGVDYDLIDFYIETESYKDLEDYIKNNPGILRTEYLINRITNEKMLYAINSFFPPDEMKKLFVKQFALKLSKINGVKNFQSYLDDLFVFVKDFSQELKLFYSDRSNGSYVLCIEGCILSLIDFIQERMLIHSKVSSKRDVLDALEKHLTFSGLDFSYLLKNQKINTDLFKMSNLDASKKKILDLMNQYLKKDKS